MGKSLEITWLERLQREAEQQSRGRRGSVEPGPDEDQETKEKCSLHVLNYHLDDLGISVPEPVEEYTLPTAFQLRDDDFCVCGIFRSCSYNTNSLITL